MSAIVGHNLFILGGWDGFECLSSVEKSTSLEDPEPQLCLLPRQNSLLDKIKNGCCVYDDFSRRILIIGGWTEKKTSNSVLAYDPETNNCDFAGLFLPKSIEAHAVVKVESQVFIFGGFDSFGVTDTIMRLDLVKRQAHMMEIKLRVARENHTC